MKTIIIDDSNPQAKKLIEYLKTLPFVEVIDDSQVVCEPGEEYNTLSHAEIIDKKITFQETAEECNAITVAEFCNELRTQVNKQY